MQIAGSILINKALQGEGRILGLSGELRCAFSLGQSAEASS